MTNIATIIAQLTGILDDETYLVGGTVRDELLGKVTKDIDIATAALPDVVALKLKIANIKPILIGKRYGTIGCRIDEYDIQITTMRAERYDPGSRKPHTTYDTSISEDLSRRDFTINSLAKKNGELIDLFGGLSDIQNRQIRAVGDPSKRFNEDPLRMLRAFRFASQLGFAIEPNTLASISANASRINIVSKERIAIEIDKMLLGDGYQETLPLFIESALFDYILPELIFLKSDDLDSPDSTQSILEHRWRAFIVVMFANSNYQNDKDLIDAVLSHIATVYKWPNKKLELVRNLAAH